MNMGQKKIFFLKTLKIWAIEDQQDSLEVQNTLISQKESKEKKISDIQQKSQTVKVKDLIFYLQWLRWLKMKCLIEWRAQQTCIQVQVTKGKTWDGNQILHYNQSLTPCHHHLLAKVLVHNLDVENFNN